MKLEPALRPDWRLGAIFALAALLYTPTWVSYVDVWSEQPYTNGFLIAPAIIWLVWRQRGAFRLASPIRGMWLPVAGLSLLWMLAVVADTRVISQGTLPILLLLMATAVFGRPVAARLASVTAIFFLAVPVWSVLAPPLRLMTIATTRATLTALGIPATFEGDVVFLEYGAFRIEDGCAGLNYLLSGLTIGGIYSLALLRGWRSRAKVVALSAVLPIVGNWVRVASLVVLGHTTRMESIFVTDSEAHLWYGWGIFVLTLLLFFPLASRVESDSEPPSGRPAPAPAGELGHDGVPALRAALIAFAAAALGPVAYHSISMLPPRSLELRSVEAATDEWTPAVTGAERPFHWRPSFTGADEQVEALWTNGEGLVVSDRLSYRDQTQGAELIGYDSRIAPDSLLVATRLVGPFRSSPHLINEAIVRSSVGHVLVWYWYRVGGVETASRPRAKLLEVWAFMSRLPYSELLAISAPCQPDSCVEAANSLLAFAGKT
jgi:EpsI family protein